MSAGTDTSHRHSGQRTTGGDATSPQGRRQGRKGKGSNPRPVTLPRHARNLLLAAVVGNRPEKWVFPYERTRQARDLAAACEASGTRRSSPHDLRRTYASRMFAAGAPLEAVQDQLGHEDPQTTRHYQGPVRVDAAVALLENYLGA